jgi:putative transposase
VKEAEKRERLRAVQELLLNEGREEYSQVQREISERLGMSVRSVQRLMGQIREVGISGIERRSRTDRGQRRISEEWQKLILTTYREGNSGGRRLSRAPVMERVKVRAQELGSETYPSHTTVYRILRPLVKKRQVVKRSLGWCGEAMVVKTREGIEITVTHSNHVWQIDHTKVDVLVVDRTGEIIGRPWLTIVVDMHSRCIMGLHIGFDAPSADVVCLALRHAILGAWGG